MKKSLISFAAFLFFIGGYLGSDALAENSKAFQGRKLFVTYCYLCHGMSGKGDGPVAGKLKVPPADLTDASRLEKRNDAELFGIIGGGGKHSLVTNEMPKWGKIIPEPQIRALVAYVRFLHRSKNPLLGDPDAGEHLYKQYCASCHGKDGKGNGVMINMISIKPADHTNPAKMDGMTNAELIDIVTNGKGIESYMPAWKGILSQAEIEAVVSYVRFLSH